MATDTEQQVEKAARVLLDKGVHTVLVKLGSKGSLLVTREQIIAMMGMLELVHLLHTSMSTAPHTSN
jgi:fructose-1-phosphate kinase PfkB-like protein